MPKLESRLSVKGLRTYPLMVFGESKGAIHCEMRSSTENRYYRIAIRISDGACYCDCPWFEYRCKMSVPTLFTGRLCRHLETYKEFLKHELQDLAQGQTITD